MIHFHENVVPLLESPEGLQQFERNYNNGDTDAIIESIRTVGCYRPIYVGSDNVIIAGHHLYYSLLEMGADKVPLMRLDYPSTDERAVRIVIGDNEIARKSRRDEAQLLSLLRDVLDGDTTGTGLNEYDLLRLVDDVEAPLPEGFGGGEVWPVVQIPCDQETYMEWHARLEDHEMAPHELLKHLMEES